VDSQKCGPGKLIHTQHYVGTHNVIPTSQPSKILSSRKGDLEVRQGTSQQFLTHNKGHVQNMVQAR
jgi:hypothetical protein